MLAAGIVHLDLGDDVVVGVASADHPDGARHADGDVAVSRSVHRFAGGEPVGFGIVEGDFRGHLGAAVLGLDLGLGFAGRNFHPVEGVRVEVGDVVGLTSTDEVDSGGQIAVDVGCHAERYG